MKCKKRRYRDEVSAKLALVSTSNNAHRRHKTEIRTYRCNRCKGYHLTSQQYKEKILA